jgi:cytochrome c-type biogenesis protein CcmF
MTEEIQYIGEHLIFGKIGYFVIILGFVAAIFSSVSYFFATNNEDTLQFSSWRKLGRIGFTIHGVAIYTTIALTFHIMIQKYYEYSYVFEHVSDDLPFRYIFSAFWEGQEGSFMLWMFWHIFLGAIIMFRAGKWEAPVLSVLMAIEVFITSMILGLHLGAYKIGSSPLALFRDTSDMPLFNNEDYVSMLGKFADGLNPLLQNYWMTIHPPTLFLGFASTAIPFAFAIAGLWRKDHKASLQPMLK